MGLNDFVAKEEGFFEAEGLDVTFDWKTFRGTQSSWKGLNYLERPQDQPYTKDKAEVIQGACVWGSICNASAGMGKFVAEAYGNSPWAIFVRPDSKIREPKDLKDVPISVGMRAGSHFNVPYRLEKYLPLANIKTVNTGGFGARLKALLDGEVEAASLLPPQIAMAEQLGLRKIIEDTFHTLWWVPEGFDPEHTKAYLRALDRAEKAMDADLAKYLPLWKLAVPGRVRDLSQVGLLEVRARRALRLQDHPALGVRRGDGSGQALEPRRLPQGQELRGSRGALAPQHRTFRTRARRKAALRVRAQGYSTTAIALISIRYSGEVILVISTMVEAGAGALKYSRRTLWIFSKCSMLRT